MTKEKVKQALEDLAEVMKAHDMKIVTLYHWDARPCVRVGNAQIDLIHTEGTGCEYVVATFEDALNTMDLGDIDEHISHVEEDLI